MTESILGPLAPIFEDVVAKLVMEPLPPISEAMARDWEMEFQFYFCEVSEPIEPPALVSESIFLGRHIGSNLESIPS